MTDELTRPELGYVKQPWDVTGSTTSPAQIALASQEPEKYSAPWSSPPSTTALAAAQSGARSEALDERFFGLHHDMPPELIAAELHGALVWKREDDGMAIALIRFDRQVEARLQTTGDLPPAPLSAHKSVRAGVS